MNEENQTEGWRQKKTDYPRKARDSLQRPYYFSTLSELFTLIHLTSNRGEGGSSVGRARYSRGGTGFDPGFGRPLPTGWGGVSIM